MSEGLALISFWPRHSPESGPGYGWSKWLLNKWLHVGLLALKPSSCALEFLTRMDRWPSLPLPTRYTVSSRWVSLGVPTVLPHLPLLSPTPVGSRCSRKWLLRRRARCKSSSVAPQPWPRCSRATVSGSASNSSKRTSSPTSLSSAQIYTTGLLARIAISAPQRPSQMIHLIVLHTQNRKPQGVDGLPSEKGYRGSLPGHQLLQKSSEGASSCLIIMIIRELYPILYYENFQTYGKLRQLYSEQCYPPFRVSS